MRGMIIRLIFTRGYGFVKDEAGETRFLHALDLEDTAVFPSLREGCWIEFEPVVKKPPTEKDNGLGVSKVRLL